MILKLFGILDIIAGVVLALTYFGIGDGAGVFFGIYLIGKGLMFINNIVSIIDIIAGVALLITVFYGESVFIWIFVLWLIQKGFFSVL